MTYKKLISGSAVKTLHIPTYFDFSAATPVHPLVLEAMTPYFSDQFYNPSALYTPAREAKHALEQARTGVAQALGVKPVEIIFTAGGSESIALAIQGVMNAPEHKKSSVVISAIEHDAVRLCAQQFPCDTIGVDEKGVVLLPELDALLSTQDSVALVSIIYASNEIGTVQHISEVSQRIHMHNRRRKKAGLSEILLHIDASQAPLYLDCNPARLGVDLMTLNGGKIYGPKQSGCLYVRTGIELIPLLRGGGQEFGMRSGTENVPSAVGFAKALELAQRGRDDRAKKTSAIRDYMIEKLEEVGGIVYGHRTKRNANNVLVGFDGVDNETLLIKLDTLGFSVAIGSACHASSDTPSHVLKALGLSDTEIRTTLRLSINEYTTKVDVDKLLEGIKKSLQL